MVSIHGDSYKNFWHKIFPSMLEQSLRRVMDGCGGMISFGPGVSELELHFNEDITAETPETLCQELNLDYTQTISCKLRLEKSSEPQTIRLGQIPKETHEGNFIINGKERTIIAQLRRGPGLTFHREKMVRSYRNPEGGKYAVGKIRYSARMIPSDGVWLEFDTFKTPEEQKGLLPLEIWESITGEDGFIRVRVRRDRWFSVADLFLAFGIEPPSDIPLGEPNHAVKYGEVDPSETEKEEREDWGEGDEWRKIGQCVGVRAEKKREDEVAQKRRIREELLDRNYLSELGRYQVNRRLGPIGGHVLQGSPYLSAEDIEGICRYLLGLCNGRDFPVDDKYSLAGKRVRLIRSHIPVSHLMIEVMPVLPPGLRPPLVMENGAVVMGDLNHLYEDLLRFLKSRQLEPQADIGRNDIRELQRYVSAVIDNRKAMPPLRDRDGKAFVRSLAHFLKGKSGFFRGNLLGKRVDYSGRAVIVPDLELDLDQCALPYAMAVEIFMPLLIPRLRDLWAVSSQEGREEPLSDHAIETRIRRTLRLSSDHRNIAEDRALVLKVLEEIGTRNPVLFNRQPTLHRLGIQAFYPKVSSHETISMHPLVTAGFNADFDGDTAAIHRVVTARALEEVKGLLAHNHLFSPANGSLTLNLGQDVALGAYFLTASEKGRRVLAEAAGGHDPEERLNKRGLSIYLRRAISRCPMKDRVAMVENIKRLLFREASSSGLSLSILDLPDMRAVRDGLIADDRSDATHILSAMEERVLGFFHAKPDHPLSIMHDSGARGNKRTMIQLIGMRGPMGKIGARNGSAHPPVVFSSLREGMKAGEYFVSCYGSRATLVDKKMGTAEAGYVTRKLVEITHPLYVTTEDCMSSGKTARRGLEIGPYTERWLDVRDFGPEGLCKKLEDKFVITLLWDIQGKDEGTPFLFEGVESLFDEKVIGRIERRDLRQRLLGVKIREERSRDELAGKLTGRVLLDPIEIKGKVIHQVDTEEVATRLADWILTRKGSITVRSPLTCEADYGVCQRCYGLDLTTMKLPEIGHKAGIIAAQSIGEPGTQLVLRNFHSGGVMGAAGISQDIPRVERFLNAKSLAQTEAQEKGLGVDSYPMLIDEIRGVYDGNGVKISDQHFEILLKGMISRFCVTDPGSDLFYPGQIVEKRDLAIAGGQVRARPMLSGIGILKRRSTGWLSSASFENTMDILAMAAIGGKTDRLLGLKGNVILGRLLPP